MIVFNNLNMGEGISGGDNVAMSTSALHSCMGIAMVNLRTRRGGLYHYPADEMANPNVTTTLSQMYNDIRPEKIVLTPAGSEKMELDYENVHWDSSQKDIDAVRGFLTRFKAATLDVASPLRKASLQWKPDGPAFNENIPFLWEDKAAPGAMRAQMKHARREVQADIWYYGGDGEVKGVLETPMRGKCCAVL